MSTETRVTKILAEHLGVKQDQIAPATTLDDLGCDSLDTVEIAMAFEEEFGISISDEQAADIKTVKDMIELVDKVMSE
jgi:acyl carrier protein